jgi:hypothetical protein
VELSDHVINNGAHLLLGKNSGSANIAIFKTKLLAVLPVTPDGLRVDVQSSTDFENEIGSSNRPHLRKARFHQHAASRVLPHSCRIFSDSTIAWSSSSETDIATNEIEQGDDDKTKRRDGKTKRLMDAFFFCGAFFG